MNERIKELAKQAGLNLIHDNFMTASQEKFAELIVKECADTIKSNQWANDNQSWSKGMQYAAELIKEQFGVEL